LRFYRIHGYDDPKSSFKVILTKSQNDEYEQAEQMFTITN